MAVGDVIQLKVGQTVPNVGDVALNVFFYEIQTGISTLDDFIGQFILDVVLNMRTLQSTACEYDYIEAVNLFNEAEFALRTFAPAELTGLIGSGPCPPSTALGFTLKRSSRAVRNGSKRIAGAPSSIIANGGIADATYLGDMNDLAEAMAADITEPIGGAVFRPVIVKRIKTANPDYPTHSKYPFLYALPTEQGETPVVDVAGCTFSVYATTQVSRKTNR